VIPLKGPLGVVGIETVSGVAVKPAVTDLLALIVTVTGFVVPVASPLQLPNAYPAFAVAVSVTTSP
jgi:hypothetical protein